MIMYWEKNENQTIKSYFKKTEKDEKEVPPTPPGETRKLMPAGRKRRNSMSVHLKGNVNHNARADPRVTEDMLRSLDEMRNQTIKSTRSIKKIIPQDDRRTPRHIKEKILEKFLKKKRSQFQKVLVDKAAEKSVSAEWGEFEKNLGFGVDEFGGVAKFSSRDTARESNHAKSLLILSSLKRQLQSMQNEAMRLWEEEEQHTLKEKALAQGRHSSLVGDRSTTSLAQLAEVE